MANTFHHGARGKKQLYGDLWHWCRNEPKWWRKAFKHKKRRAAWKKCEQKIRTGTDLDDMVYPLDSRPWIYYW